MVHREPIVDEVYEEVKETIYTHHLVWDFSFLQVESLAALSVTSGAVTITEEIFPLYPTSSGGGGCFIFLLEKGRYWALPCLGPMKVRRRLLRKLEMNPSRNQPHWEKL